MPDANCPAVGSQADATARVLSSANEKRHSHAVSLNRLKYNYTIFLGKYFHIFFIEVERYV